MADNSRLKIRAFFKEFPFLSRYVNERKVDQVKVERVDENLLDVTQKAYFFDKNGEKVGKTRRHIFLLTELGFCGESVSEALQRIGERAKDISFILTIQKRVYGYHEAWAGMHTLYKTPAGTDLLSWLKQREMKCREEMRTE